MMLRFSSPRKEMYMVEMRHIEGIVILFYLLNNYLNSSTNVELKPRRKPAVMDDHLLGSNRNRDLERQAEQKHNQW